MESSEGYATLRRVARGVSGADEEDHSEVCETSLTPTPALVKDFLLVLNRLEIPYMVGGSFASSLWGQPRQTHDLDLAVMLTSADIQPLFDAVSNDFMASINDMQEAIGSRDEFRAFQLIHFEETFKLDVFVLRTNEYTKASFARTQLHPILPEFLAPFASAEDTVITKLRWFVLGNRVSDKQWNDIVQVLEMQQGSLDEDYMTHWATHFDVLDLLREAQLQVVV